MFKAENFCSSDCGLTLGIFLVTSERAFLLDGDSSCAGCLRLGDRILKIWMIFVSLWIGC